MDYIYIAYLKKLHLEVVYRRKYLKWEAHPMMVATGPGQPWVRVWLPALSRLLLGFT